MKYKLTTLMLCIGIFASSQIIEWSPDTKLHKNDFQGKIPDNTINHAGTAYNIGYEILSNSIWTGRMKIRIYVIFNTSESWLNEAFYTDDLLNHEQKHFDIAQIFAYKLQHLINKEIKNSKDFNVKFEMINKLIGDECISFQKKYDAETDHGTIVDVQKKYDNDIKQLLEESRNHK